MRAPPSRYPVGSPDGLFISSSIRVFGKNAEIQELAAF
jgi:hypothetical protein